MAGVRRAQEYIAAATSTSWCCPSRFGGKHELDPFQVYRALRLINPSPYMYYCELGGVSVVGSSPEALVKLSGRAARAAADRRHAAAHADDAADRCAARSRAAAPIRRKTRST